MSRRLFQIAVTGLLLLAAADSPEPAAVPATPKSPKAVDAMRIDAAAIRKASTAYWQACAAADQRLENELKSSANAAHARNDGAEEQACLEAANDVHARVDTEFIATGGNKPVAPLTPLRCEGKDQEKKGEEDKK